MRDVRQASRCVCESISRGRAYHGLMVVWMVVQTQDIALLLFGIRGLCDVLGPHLPFTL
jgi:hypothetical protein